MSKPKPKRYQLRVELSKEQHQMFVSLSNENNKKPSVIAREIILSALYEDDSKKHSITALPKRDDYDPDKLKTVETRFTEEEIEVIDLVAKTYNVSRNKALIIIIRTMLLRAPSFTPEDRNAIYKSNQELRRIGGHLNQIAKQFNALAKHNLIENKAELELELKLLGIMTKDKSLFELIHSHIKLVKSIMDKANERFD